MQFLHKGVGFDFALSLSLPRLLLARSEFRRRIDFTLRHGKDHLEIGAEAFLHGCLKFALMRAFEQMFLRLGYGQFDMRGVQRRHLAVLRELARHAHNPQRLHQSSP